MPFDASLYTRILIKALDRGKTKAQAFCRSDRLRRSMYTPITMEGTSKSTGHVSVPQYWAKFFHNGRSAFVAKAKALVWFKDPRKDPRQNPAYHTFKNTERPLDQLISKAEFKQLVADKELIIRRATGPVDKSKENPFFSNTGGMAGLDKEVGDIAKRETYRYMEEELKRRGLKKKKITRVI